MIISTQIALKLYIETLISKISKHWYCQSSYRDSSYWNKDIENIEPPNNIEPISLKFHIEPALGQAINQNNMHVIFLQEWVAYTGNPS